MVGPIPPAFGGTPDPYLGLSDEEVLASAKNSLRLAQTLPLASAARAEACYQYAAASSELNRRLFHHLRAQIGDYGERLTCDG